MERWLFDWERRAFSGSGRLLASDRSPTSGGGGRRTAQSAGSEVARRSVYDVYAAQGKYSLPTTTPAARCRHRLTIPVTIPSAPSLLA